jgi:hypothetical protein
MSMQAEGVIMRLFDDYTQEITEGVDAYDAASDTMSIEGYGAYITSTDGIDTPMSMMFRHEYNAVADKTEDGSPAFLYVKDSVNGMSLILNPAPDGNWASFTYVRQRKIRDVSTGSNHLDIADKYQDAVMLNVAWKFCGHYKMFSQMPLFKSLYNDEVKRVITDDTPRGPTRMRMAPIIERD